MANSRVLISVSDKTGLTELARALIAAGYEIIASDGTASALLSQDIAVRKIEEVTGSKEILAGRVKTLHPLIHGAILFDRNDPDQVAEAEANELRPIDIVIVNLYPAGKFDIGGPALIRAAAKNYAAVSVITHPDQYSELINSLTVGPSLSDRKRWAARAIELTARYDLEILREFSQPLRYGENPHQSGWLAGADGIAGGVLLQGEVLSFNNYLDGDIALRIAQDHHQPTAAIVKHGIPVGVATNNDSAKALTGALVGDPLSAFGGVLATNFEISDESAELLSGKFLELLIAPSFSDGARRALERKQKLRVLRAGKYENEFQSREISGGFLFQSIDQLNEKGDQPANWRLVSGAHIDAAKLEDLRFAWLTAARSRSNSIVIVKDGIAIGIGGGQVNRLTAAEIAVARAGGLSVDAVAASDGFFPFADGIESLIKAGITAVVSPGGSIRDAEVISAATKAGISLYFTGVRHFSHN